MIRESEDLPEIFVLYTSADRGIACDLEDKRDIPGSMKVGPGIFFARARYENFPGRTGMKNEQAHVKMTLLLIKDWDAFQAAMREMMSRADRREIA